MTNTPAAPHYLHSMSLSDLLAHAAEVADEVFQEAQQHFAQISMIAKWLKPEEGGDSPDHTAMLAVEALHAAMVDVKGLYTLRDTLRRAADLAKMEKAA